MALNYFLFQGDQRYSSGKCQKSEHECYHFNSAEHFLTIKVKHQFHPHLLAWPIWCWVQSGGTLLGTLQNSLTITKAADKGVIT